jgi:hypothetical protein
MQKTIHKLTKAMVPNQEMNFSFAEVLRQGITQKHGEVVGL